MSSAYISYLLAVREDARGEPAVSRFGVAEAVVNADNQRRVPIFAVHSLSLLMRKSVEDVVMASYSRRVAWKAMGTWL